ncbi:MAG: hypothetical protein ABI629_23630 [bacterium]
MKMRIASLACAAALLAGSTAFAQPARPPRHGGGPSGSEPPPHCPPAAAFAACNDAVDGDSCSFAGRGDEAVDGTCFVFDDGGAVCVPAGAPRPNAAGGEEDQ